MKYEKILFVAGTLGQGGAERQLYFMCRELQQTGRKVEVATLEAGEHWEHELLAINVPVHHIASKGKIGRLNDTLAIARQVKPQLIYCMHFFANVYAGFAGRRLGIRTIGSVRNNGYYELHNLGWIPGLICYYLPHRIVANSEHGARNIKRIFRGRAPVPVLPNAIDLSLFPLYTRKSAHLPTLILVARFVVQKRVDLFLKLVRKLLDSGVNCRGLVVGYGPEEVSLKALQAELGLTAEITFSGRQQNVFEWLRQADFLVSTSLHEGTSNVYLEAMAAQLPIVALNFEGVENLVIQGNTGWIAGNEQELFNLCRMVIQNPNIALEAGGNARKMVENKYALSSLANNFIHVVG
jgi:glycosyltransferase involved in cell wall biosynthesis